MSDESKQGFVIKDKRRFEADGAARDGETKDSATPNSAFVLKESAESKARPAETAAIDFSSFIMSLATQTLMQLGEVKPPEGVKIPIDVESARQSIEVIAMLEEKTRGNLEPHEDKLVEEILHTLRLHFLKQVKK